MKNRFYLPTLTSGMATAELTGEEFHHAARVARVKPGEGVEIFDGKGLAISARVVALEKDRASLELTGVVAPSREPATPIILAIALIQPEKFELVLQKGTELGVASFIPLLTDRCEVRSERVAGKRARWEKIVLEAVKQSGRSRIPAISEITTFEAAIGRAGSKIMFDPDGEVSPPIGDPPITCFIGPEGGWSEEELTRAPRAGVAIQTLGPRRLRAETAAIAGITLVARAAGNL